MKDSLWSVDLFRCESITLTTHWVLVVMDQFTRRIIGFGIRAGAVDGIALCRMFNHAIAGKGLPSYLSSDNDPLFEFHRWEANLRVLGVDEVKTVPYTPTSHPFVERLIGTIRREYLDKIFFWNTVDLEKKLAALQCLLQPASRSQLPGWPNASPKSVGNASTRKRCSTISAGRLTAVGCTSCRLSLDYQFATHKEKDCVDSHSPCRRIPYHW